MANTSAENEIADIRTKEESHMDNRVAFLWMRCATAVLLHVHIPKAGGTALAIALSSDCKCMKEWLPDVPFCKKCAQVRGNDGLHMDYTFSRATGWRLGVHSPYAVVRYVASSKKLNFRGHGMTPVYVLMLREPFERFVSECRSWVNKKTLRAVDWGLTTKSNSTSKQLVFHPAVHIVDKLLQRKHSADASESERRGPNLTDRMMEYAQLPPSFILQNRQVKMVGGTIYDFNMRFDPRRNVGSRWEPRSEKNSNKNVWAFYHNAFRTLGQEPTVLLGLHERFAEYICLLEALFGDDHSFNWKEGRNSHNFGKSYNLTVATPAQELYPEVYEEWAKRNQEDIKLYRMAGQLFEMQFQAALRLLRQEIESGSSRLASVPHCKAFLPV
jgi:hypothetical protein